MRHAGPGQHGHIIRHVTEGGNVGGVDAKSGTEPLSMEALLTPGALISTSPMS